MFDLERIRQLVVEKAPSEAFSTIRLPGSSESATTPRRQRGSDSGCLPVDYDPSSLCSREDFLWELGIPCEEFFCRLVEEHGGSLPQQEFIEYANISKSTISRILQKMEADGMIEREQVGREKIVTLAGSAPSDTPSVTTEGDDPLRA